ncbi:C2 family cysteine protease [Microbacterium sp. cx-59]|uniref:C2 family cysteine protease n=1 Tax=Microbacterium sp. cx-59 TaxID=2891207 RepID=UPI001E3EA82B|nr:C2 family cysteine protease [Microbacterium sp. cx-59]MCC4907523.1 hypothetical protein [Microbacterium sp. cx-59]
MSTLGNPDAIEAAAARLDTLAESTRAAARRIRTATADEWEGEAARAYAEAQQTVEQDADELAETYRTGAATLQRYAGELRRHRAAYESAAASFETARQAVRDNPLDVGALLDAGRARLAALGAAGEIQAAAARAADELRAAIDDDADGNAWWDPFGWWTHDDTVPDQPVNESITDENAFDADDVDQGSIGDCFMLSSIVALLGSDEGDDFIRENVRWDAEKNGYWVTLYENGEPTEVFVDKVFGNGARQSDGDWLPGDKASIAALYEAAIEKEYGYGFLDGGEPEDAMTIITGRDVEVVENESHAGLTESQIDPLRENLANGGQVVLSSPREGDHTITVEGPDGSTREIDIVNKHSYAVTRIDADGSVWMRNPWGPGNSADGGGEFKVSAEDIADLFWRATYTDVTD